MPTDTKDRILDVAERLFAEDGLDGTSLRTITRDANVNLAAVNYHFGSKEGLIQAAFQRRISPINRERLRQLAAYEGSLKPGELPDVASILGCFVRPIFAAANGSGVTDPLFLRLVGRLYTDAAHSLRSAYLREFATVLARFEAALARALPELSREELTWRLHFCVGTIAHSLLTSGGMQEMSNGICDGSDYQGLQRRLLHFVTAGLCVEMRVPAAR